MRFSDAKNTLRPLGVSIRRTVHGEYRVNFIGGVEDTASYQDDLPAAVATGLYMARAGDPYRGRAPRHF